MVKKIFYLVLLIVAGVLGYFGYQKFFPSEATRVRRLLTEVAEVTSFSPNEKLFTRLASANKLSGFFSADVEINVQVPGEGSLTIQGRDELVRIAVGYRSTFNAARVEFLDINVALDAEKQSATAELTAKITEVRQRDFGVQELKIQLRKIDGDWRITQP